MQEVEIVIRDGEILDLLTLSPIKSGFKEHVVLQSTLRHLSCPTESPYRDLKSIGNTNRITVC